MTGGKQYYEENDPDYDPHDPLKLNPFLDKAPKKVLKRIEPKPGDPLTLTVLVNMVEPWVKDLEVILDRFDMYKWLASEIYNKSPEFISEQELEKIKLWVITLSRKGLRPTDMPDYVLGRFKLIFPNVMKELEHTWG